MSGFQPQKSRFDPAGNSSATHPLIVKIHDEWGTDCGVVQFQHYINGNRRTVEIESEWTVRWRETHSSDRAGMNGHGR